MYASDIKEPPAIIVVVLKEVLVARDIEMIVRDCRPSSKVLLAQSLRDAVSALPSGRVELAIVQQDAATIAASTLGQRVAADGGKVVVISEDEGRRLPDGWTALLLPFASDDVASLLCDEV